MTATALSDLLRLAPYQAYSYSYPHKTAYRPIAPRASLADAWADEPRDALFLYLHVPFCSYRCGFCNLFALARPAPAVSSSVTFHASVAGRTGGVAISPAE